ncbi:hypothetical protein Scep_011008 [Stephania cephalantha]|uniref:BTB domain-containing protein n=1 Tax=Stephania cephalantha TaxID=152367 RepID=A0AAP0JW95_9MAGN
MKSSKRGGGEKPRKNSSNQFSTLHQRLYQALNLGIKCSDDGRKKWECKDIETQKLVVRAIDAFVSCICHDMLRDRLVKDAIGDMLLALEGVFQSENETILGMAANIAVKLVDILGSSILPFNVLELVSSLSYLVSYPHSSIAASSAVTLNKILAKLTPRRMKIHHDVWEILKQRKVIHSITCGLEDFIVGSKPLEYFIEISSLLKTILLRWPSARYPFWSNATVKGLDTIYSKLDSYSAQVSVLQLYSAQVSVLQLYSSLALCGTVAKKLLENGEAFVLMIVHCMNNSKPHSIRVEAFKLAQCFLKSQECCARMMSLGGKSIITAIIRALSGWRICNGKVPKEQMLLMVEACSLALVTRWPGDHHSLFWELGIDRVLLELLLGHSHQIILLGPTLSMEGVIALALEGINSGHLVGIRPYVLDIVGWLATNCTESFNPEIHSNINCLNILITCGCLTLADFVKLRQLYPGDVPYPSKVEPACRAVLLMINSPCKYIASQARNILSELLHPNVDTYLKYLFDCLKCTMNWCNLGMESDRQTVVNLIALACIPVLPRHHSVIIESNGVRILFTFITWCVKNHATIVSCMQSSSGENTCCWFDESWEGRNSFLFFSLCGLSELIHHSTFLRNHGEKTSGLVVDDMEIGGSDAHRLVQSLHDICHDTFSSGVVCFATYILSFFGLYGYPSRLGKRIGKALKEIELADVQFRLVSGETLEVHGVILTARCQSLLPPKPHTSEEIGGGSNEGVNMEQKKFKNEVHLSSRIICQTLKKLLEFVYVGSVKVDAALVKDLRMLAKGCQLHDLLGVLDRKKPKWGRKVEHCNYIAALGPTGYEFSDIILEANEGRSTNSTCSVCTLASHHVHAHKIILSISSDYMRAMFSSAMQESFAQIIKVPVSWEALSKLMIWFYSDELPRPSSGCLWDNMDVDCQLQQLHPFIELCWLAEFWLLEHIREEALAVVMSHLNSSKELSLKIIVISADLNQLEIVEAAANYLAPSFPHLRDSGDLEALNENLVDVMRVAYVSLSQSGERHQYN